MMLDILRVEISDFSNNFRKNFMLISKKWLSEYISLPDGLSDIDLSERLTNAVVEVEKVLNQAAEFDHMVLGKIISILQHPNADRLKICEVDVGERNVKIVCGGTNIAEGMNVAVALPGARVRWHGEGELIELAKTSIRGEESEGMICAGSEIGKGKSTDKDHEIMDLSEATDQISTPLAKVFHADDVIFEIEHKSITNRPDLFGHYGIAREISALYSIPLREYRSPKIHLGKSIRLFVDVEDKTLCPRYMAVAIEGVKVESSPKWLSNRLESCGIHSINNLVDITNYVLLELGQPMHVFDVDKIGGKDIQINVRNALKNETLLALDDKTYKLDSEKLVITDGKNPIAIAGVMGGKESGVSDKTTRIVFESANFSGTSVRKTSQTLSLRSESSVRFEKELDPELCAQALARAIEITLQLCPNAHVASKIIDTQSSKQKPLVLTVSPEIVNQRLGTEISPNEMKDILSGLGFDVATKAKTFLVTIPSWRSTKDITIPEDVIEEIARIYGYNKISSTLPMFEINPPIKDAILELVRKSSDVLVHEFGATETYTYAFTSGETLSRLGWDTNSHLKLANPLSEERPYLVQSLIPNLLECVVKNQRVEDEVLLFESDRVFLNDSNGDLTGEDGKKLPSQPHFFSVAFAKKSITEPFWHGKQIALAILNHCGFEGMVCSAHSHTQWQHVGRTAQLCVGDVEVGILAEIDPLHSEKFGLDHRTVVLEINLDVLSKIQSEKKTYTSVAMYPSVVRDLAFLIDDKIEYSTIESAIKIISPMIVSVELFDVYRGKGVKAGKKSVAIHVEFRSGEKTLETKEVDVVVDKIKKMLEKDFGGIIRQ